MKQLTTTLIAIFFTVTAMSQAIEGSTDYNKTKQPAVICEYAYPPDLVETVLTDDLKQKGFGKGKSTKGFDVYQAINFTEISLEKIDLYVKVERKSRKEKDITIVTMLVSKGYDNFISGAADASVMQNTMAYVNGLKPKLEKNSLELQIAAQEEILKKEEKKYNNLTEEAADLEKKRKKIEENIADNKKDQEKQKTEVDKQRQILESIKAQRKG
jgi:hypothetical protein